MKKIVLLSVLVAGFLAAAAQPGIDHPVSWTFTAQKTADKTYEIHMTATMKKGWHLYSQTQPENAIAIPTNFTLTKNPLLTASGSIKEIGKMEKYLDKKLDIGANQYGQKVDFVQTVTVKSKAKTKFSGTVEYQTCDDHKCLPPRKVNFSVDVN